MRNQSSSSMKTLFFSRTRSAWFITAKQAYTARGKQRGTSASRRSVVLLQEVVAQDGEHAGIDRRATRYSRPRLADGHGRWWLLFAAPDDEIFMTSCFKGVRLSPTQTL